MKSDISHEGVVLIHSIRPSLRAWRYSLLFATKKHKIGKRTFVSAIILLMLLSFTKVFVQAQGENFFKTFDSNKATETNQAGLTKRPKTRLTQPKIQEQAIVPPIEQVAQLPADNADEAPSKTEVTLKSNTKGRYAFGQCTYYVASRRPVPAGWGNAKSWFSRAKAAGFKTGDIAEAGAIAWTATGRNGHVAYVERVEGDQVYISDMNYSGINRVSFRWVNMNEFRYIY